MTLPEVQKLLGFRYQEGVYSEVLRTDALELGDIKKKAYKRIIEYPELKDTLQWVSKGQR